MATISMISIFRASEWSKFEASRCPFIPCTPVSWRWIQVWNSLSQDCQRARFKSPQLKADQGLEKSLANMGKGGAGSRSAGLTIGYSSTLCSPKYFSLCSGRPIGKNLFQLLSICKPQMHKHFGSRLLLEMHSSGPLHAEEGPVSALSEPWA